jgi:hypothetical protein
VRLFLPNSFLQSPALATFIDILPLIPLTLAIIAFTYQARTGFTLRGPGIDPLYLPSRFKDAIAFIRNVQDGKTAKKGKPDKNSKPEQED